MAIDDTDRRILHELQRDARISNQELADRIGLSPSPCLRRVRRLEEAGILSGYTATVNQNLIGLPITAFIRITLNSHSEEVVGEVDQYIHGIPETIEAYLIAGDHDYLLKVVASSLDDYERILREHIRRIPALASLETTFAFATVKATSPYPVR